MIFPIVILAKFWQDRERLTENLLISIFWTDFVPIILRIGPSHLGYGLSNHAENNIFLDDFGQNYEKNGKNLYLNEKFLYDNLGDGQLAKWALVTRLCP